MLPLTGIVFAVSIGAFYHFGYKITAAIWAITYAAFLASFLVTFSSSVRVISSSWLIFLYPLCALLSIAWSESPSVTLYKAPQLAMTFLIAVIIAMHVSIESTLKVLFILLFSTAILSILSIQLNLGLAYTEHGGIRGVFSHKNTLGSLMVVLFILSIAFFGSGRWRMSSLLAGVSALYLIFLSNSATSLLAFIFVAFLFCVFYMFKTYSANIRTFIMIIVVLVFLISFQYLIISDFDLIRYVLNFLGRNETLTGRTILWRLAEQEISSRPILGYGFGAYWAKESRVLQATMLINMVIPATTEGGFFFHNSLFELAINVGVLGAATYVTFYFLTMWRVFSIFTRRNDFIFVAPVLIGMYLLLLSVVESALFAQHSIHNILLVIFFLRCGAQELSSGHGHVTEPGRFHEVQETDR